MIGISLVLFGLSGLFSLFGVFQRAGDPSPGQAFDFWVGEWKVHWYGKDSARIEGANRIEKILDGKVLREEFEDPSTGFRGTSISVFKTADSTWRQSWADNQGGYFDFIGEVGDGVRIFRTHPGAFGSDSVMRRMRFHDIGPDRLTWDWEGTRDGGKSWNLLWRIHYERATAVKSAPPGKRASPDSVR